MSGRFDESNDPVFEPATQCSNPLPHDPHTQSTRIGSKVFRIHCEGRSAPVPYVDAERLRKESLMAHAKAIHYDLTAARVLATQGTDPATIAVREDVARYCNRKREECIEEAKRLSLEAEAAER